MRIYLLLLLLSFFYRVCGQPAFTANDTVPYYGQPFGYGANMGVYPPYTDDDLANIAAGNPAKGIEGIGVNTLRPALPEDFLNFWGYDIRKSTFQHYLDVGCVHNTVFLGFPSDEHLDPITYCPGRRPMTFENLYEPIWDSTGTAVNEENYFAHYVYQTVEMYGASATYYEITNEPDFSFTVNSILPDTMPESWYNRPPDPCNYAFGAPVYHYIRMLRVAYEVIKTYDPVSYVAVGGIGYPSFLDNLLRYTDNPMDGAVDPDFPLRGGAYFDVLSFHSYPHIDNSLRFWDNSIMDFRYTRHSDAAVDGYLRLQKEMQDVLDRYGYDGHTYPRKRFICTETNVPSKTYGEYYGSFAYQRNYVGKTLIKSQQAGIDQVHYYTLADLATAEKATFEYERMGLYGAITDEPLYTHERNAAGTMFATVEALLGGYAYDAAQTDKLALPAQIDGVAFRHPSGKFRYALWARTQEDRREDVVAYYSFPTDIVGEHLAQYAWNYEEQADSCVVNSQLVRLTAEPTFFEPVQLPVPIDLQPQKAMVFPNPATEQINIFFELTEERISSLDLFHSDGRHVGSGIQNQRLAPGSHQLKLERGTLAAGAYVVRLQTGSRLQFLPVVIR